MPGTAPAGDQRADLRDQLCRHDHDRLSRGFERTADLGPSGRFD